MRTRAAKTAVTFDEAGVSPLFLQEQARRDVKVTCPCLLVSLHLSAIAYRNYFEICSVVLETQLQTLVSWAIHQPLRHGQPAHRQGCLSRSQAVQHQGHLSPAVPHQQRRLSRCQAVQHQGRLSCSQAVPHQQRRLSRSQAVQHQGRLSRSQAVPHQQRRLSRSQAVPHQRRLSCSQAVPHQDSLSNSQAVLNRSQTYMSTAQIVVGVLSSVGVVMGLVSLSWLWHRQRRIGHLKATKTPVPARKNPGHIYKYQRASYVERASRTFNLFVVVSGLLTTSTFPALYASTPGATINSNNVTVAPAGASDRADLDYWFRALATVSFYSSLTCIVACAIALYLLSFFTTFDDNQYELEPSEAARDAMRATFSYHNALMSMWGNDLVQGLYQWAYFALIVSILAALISGAFACVRFLDTTAAWVLGIVFGGITAAFVVIYFVIVVFHGRLVTTAEHAMHTTVDYTVPYSSLLAYKQHKHGAIDFVANSTADAVLANVKLSTMLSDLYWPDGKQSASDNG